MLHIHTVVLMYAPYTINCVIICSLHIVVSMYAPCIDDAVKDTAIYDTELCTVWVPLD